MMRSTDATVHQPSDAAGNHAPIDSDNSATREMVREGTVEPTTERGRRKRAAIVTAAREVFEQFGFKDARIADIATRASASYGSFYTYFDSKEEIFREVVQEVVGEMFLRSRVGSKVTDPVERIETANRKYIESYRDHARMMAVMEEVSAYDGYTRGLRMQIRQRFVDRIETAIRRLQDDGKADQELNAAVAAEVLGGMIERFAQTWVPRRTVQEVSQAIPTITTIWARGIGLR